MVSLHPFRFIAIDIRGTSTETIGTDPRWGTLSVSNLTAQIGTKPQTDGSNFLAQNLPLLPGSNTYVAAICDEAGNIGYATNTLAYTIVTNATFQYNTAGCITNIAHTGTGGYSKSLALDWDERYRLKSVKSAQSVDVSYTYDVLNRRTSRTAGGSPATTEYYIYDGNQIIADVDSSGNLLRSYIYGSGIDNILSMTVYETSITNTYYYLKDHQNTVLALVDSSGTIVETYEYDAYGRTKVFSASGSELSSSAYGNRYTFQGRENDWATGLIYFRARWYNPITGRWLSKDPIGISGELNLYVFVFNNPVNFVDPMGLVREEIGLNKNYKAAIDTGSGVSPHIHIYKNGKEIAKVNRHGGYMLRHKGRILKKPSQIPSSVRNKIGRLAKKLPKILAGTAASIVMFVMEPTVLGDDGYFINGELVSEKEYYDHFRLKVTKPE